MSEVLVTTAEVAVVAKGRKSAADVEAEALALGLWVTENWRGEKCLTAQAAKDFVDGTARNVFEHEEKQRRHQEATVEWQQRQVAAANAAAERVRAEHVGHVDGRAWGEQNRAAQRAWVDFEANEPKPRLG